MRTRAAAAPLRWASVSCNPSNPRHCTTRRRHPKGAPSSRHLRRRPLGRRARGRWNPKRWVLAACSAPAVPPERPRPPRERPVFLLTEFDLASQTRLNHFLINYSKVRLERADFCIFCFFLRPARTRADIGAEPGTSSARNEAKWSLARLSGTMRASP